MTSTLPERERRASYPPGLPVRRGDRRLPDRGRVGRGRPRRVDLGPLLPHARQVAGGDTGDVACDHYHRWRADLDLIAALGIESYRFSISWPRVQPDGRGALNAQGRALLPAARRGTAGARDRADGDALPLGPAAGVAGRRRLGGARHGRALRRVRAAMAERARRRGRGVDHAQRAVGDGVPRARRGAKAPGLRDWPTALRVSHHLLLSHGRAVQALRAGTPAGTPVGITLNLHPQRPASDSEDGPRGGPDRRRLPEPLVPRPGVARPLPGGHARAVRPRATARRTSVPTATWTLIAQPIDFLGVNYYFPQRVAADPDAVPLGVPRRRRRRRRSRRWAGSRTPTGLHEMLARLRRDYGEVPIAITENGARVPGRRDGRRARGGRRPRRLPRAGTSRRSARRSTTASTCAATSSGRCSTTSSGSRATRSASGSSTSTTRPSARVPKRSGHWYRDHIAAARSA